MNTTNPFIKCTVYPYMCVEHFGRYSTCEFHEYSSTIMESIASSSCTSRVTTTRPHKHNIYSSMGYCARLSIPIMPLKFLVIITRMEYYCRRSQRYHQNTSKLISMRGVVGYERLYAYADSICAWV